MAAYRIVRVAGEPPLTARPWDAEALSIDQYPWYAGGEKPATRVRLLYAAAAIYLQFLCDDRHSYADHTEINSAVCEDSCVEFFAMPDPAGEKRYFNLEINCCGTYLLGCGRGREEICAAFVDPAVSLRHLKIAASVSGRTKEESPDDDGWWVAAMVPFALVSEIICRPIKPTSGSIWRANFYRCGGRIDPQHACWSTVDATAHPQPDFHRPEYFGELHFA